MKITWVKYVWGDFLNFVTDWLYARHEGFIREISWNPPFVWPVAVGSY